MQTEAQKRATRVYNRKLRRQALSILGMRCSRCGFNDPRALQIDHRNGNGHAMRKITNTYSFYRMVISDDRREEKYQTLCANCNLIKKIELGEHRYKNPLNGTDSRIQTVGATEALRTPDRQVTMDF